MNRIVACVVPAAVALALFAPAVGHEFLHWDDPAYVTGNPLLHRLACDGIADILDPRTRTLGAWTPTTLLSYAVEVRLFELQPAFFHATNVGLHAVNALLVALLLGRLGLGALGVVLGGLFFAVHPLQVEPVAWVSARKDLLAATLSLGAVLLYLRGTGAARGGALVLFALALGAKAAAVVVPLWLLVLHVALRSRPARPERWTLAAMAAMAGLRGTLEIASQAEAAAGASALGLLPRMAAMIEVLGRYVRRWVLPDDLAAAYPIAEPGAWTVAVFVLLALVAAGAIRLSRARAPLRAGLLWWPVALLPVLNLLPAPYLEADRYQYLALVGPALWLGYWGERAARHGPAARAAAGVGLLLFLSLLAAQTRSLLADWRSDAVFFEAQLDRNPQWWIGRLAFALWHLEQDRLEDAEAQVDRVAERLPDLGRVYLVRSLIAERRGDREGALALQEEATRRDPSLTPAWGKQCVLLGALQRYREAVPRCERALGQDRHLPEVRRALALALVGAGNLEDEAGRTDDALRLYARALEHEPGLFEAHYHGAVALHRAGRMEEAVRQYWIAASLRPEDADALTRAGTLLRRLDRPREAVAAYHQALAVDPGRAEARYGLAAALASMGDLEGARSELRRLLEMRPETPEARRALAKIEAALRAANAPAGGKP